MTLGKRTRKKSPTLLTQGHPVLHSDLDVVWLANVENSLERLVLKYDADIVSEISYGLPQDVIKRWGFICNTGLTLYRKTPRTMQFVGKLIKNTDTCEQCFFNRILYEENVTWSDEKIAGVEGFLKVGKSVHGLKVVVLPDVLVARDTKFNPSIALHPYGWKAAALCDLKTHSI